MGNNDSQFQVLAKVFSAILQKNDIQELYQTVRHQLEKTTPYDILFLVDHFVMAGIPVSDLKPALNKFLNLLYKPLSMLDSAIPSENLFLGAICENNRILIQKLNELKPVLKRVNSEVENQHTKSELVEKFTEIERFMQIYEIKENVLFPLVESGLKEFRCISVMWSLHDDVRRDLKSLISILSAFEFDKKGFNRLCGDIFFNMFAIRFREEKILYPVLIRELGNEKMNSLMDESIEIGFPWFQPLPVETANWRPEKVPGMINLGTGLLSAEQIILIFNHLPVDITFVDENDKVRFFSEPPHRIFRRTKSVIGRDVHNCHPPESVHVVEQIVKSFRDGKKDEASFWINMKGRKYLIQYFALRDANQVYKGVVEVSQEISGIQQLQGEKRLLEWE